jgi:L-ascorbate metabolism protein UlaG (beta-lactamase superfamily)
VKLTKYTHACLVLEETGKKLVIDPGVFTTDFTPSADIVAVIVTHQHQDHLDPKQLTAILQKNPSAKIFTPGDISEQFSHPNVQVVTDGSSEQIGPFGLRFFGTQHHLIHATLPVPLNTGVLVNEQVFYPGDAFTKPDVPVQVLAIPANAPWASVAESIDYLLALKPAKVLPTHNGLLSEAGHLVYNGALQHGCGLSGSSFEYLKPGQSLDV